jgi:hypothetical protein
MSPDVDQHLVVLGADAGDEVFGYFRSLVGVERVHFNDKFTKGGSGRGDRPRMPSLGSDLPKFVERAGERRDTVAAGAELGRRRARPLQEHREQEECGEPCNADDEQSSEHAIPDALIRQSTAEHNKIP